MKKRYLYVAALAALLNFSSCSNSFLDLNPDTAITANTFYKTLRPSTSRFLHGFQKHCSNRNNDG